MHSLAAELITECHTLHGQAGKAVVRALRPRLRAMNSYYTNKIEGQHTRPGEIERAIQKKFNADDALAKKQRVAVARALVFNPDILLMDEPLGALDKNLRQAMQSEIRNLHKRIGVTIIYVTHDQEEAMNMSDRVVVMNQGRVEQNGPPSDIYNHPETVFVATFLGNCNLFACREMGGGTLRIDCGEEIDLPAGAAFKGASLVGVRPERIALAPESASRKAGAIGFKAIVRDISFSGPDYRVELAVGRTAVVARCVNNGKAPALPGQTVSLSFEPADVFPLRSPEMRT